MLALVELLQNFFAKVELRRIEFRFTAFCGGFGGGDIARRWVDLAFRSRLRNIILSSKERLPLDVLIHLNRTRQLLTTKLMVATSRKRGKQAHNGNAKYVLRDERIPRCNNTNYLR